MVICARKWYFRMQTTSPAFYLVLLQSFLLQSTYKFISHKTNCYFGNYTGMILTNYIFGCVDIEVSTLRLKHIVKSVHPAVLLHIFFWKHVFHTKPSFLQEFCTTFLDTRSTPLSLSQNLRKEKRTCLITFTQPESLVIFILLN